MSVRNYMNTFPDSVTALGMHYATRIWLWIGTYRTWNHAKQYRWKHSHSVNLLNPCRFECDSGNIKYMVTFLLFLNIQMVQVLQASSSAKHGHVHPARLIILLQVTWRRRSQDLGSQGDDQDCSKYSSFYTIMVDLPRWDYSSAGLQATFNINAQSPHSTKARCTCMTAAIHKK